MNLNKNFIRLTIIVALISIVCVSLFIFKPYLYEIFLVIPEVSFTPQPYDYLEKEVIASERPDNLSLEIAQKTLKDVFSIQGRSDSTIYPELNIELDSLWHTSKIDNGAWFYALNSLFIIYDIISAHETTNNINLIERGEKILRSWVTHNPRSKPNNRLNWNDHVTANRSVAICTFMDYLNSKNLLNDSLAEFITPVLIDHGIFLSSHLNYFYSQNHGIFEDYALLVILTHLSQSKLTQSWLDLVVERLNEQIKLTYSLESIHMENSPGYHIEITQLLERIYNYFINEDLAPPKLLSDVLPGAKAAYGSFIMPDGLIVPLGDTPRNSHFYIPETMINENLLTVYADVGYAIIRGPYYLFFAASNRSPSHKHRDDLSFILADSIGEIITDVGFLSNVSSPENRYSVTWQAHNTISETQTYTYSYTKRDISEKCGILDWGNIDNKIFIKGMSLRKSGFQQVRQLYYDLDCNLIIISDYIGNNKGEDYYKYFHLPPQSVAKKNTNYVYEIGDRTTLIFWPKQGNIRVIREQKDPLQGWVAVPARYLIPATTLEHTIPGDILTSAVVITDKQSKLEINYLDSSKVEITGRDFKKILRFFNTHVVDSTKLLSGEDTTIVVHTTDLIQNKYLENHRKLTRYGVPVKLKSRMKVFYATVAGWIIVILIIFIIGDRWLLLRVTLLLSALIINMVMFFSIYYRL